MGWREDEAERRRAAAQAMKALIEERQRVANRLSYAAADGTGNPLGTLKYILGLSVSDTYRDVFRALVMLIGPGTCEWVADENGVYRTECGLAHVFEFDGVTENGYRYCPYCGGLVTERDAGWRGRRRA